MKKILVLVPGYLPGFKSGGPVRTIANMVDELGDEIDFSIVCLDRDLGDKKPYNSINTNQWNQQGKAKVFYIERGPRGAMKLISILRATKFKIIHINGFFSFQFSILPLFFIKIFTLNTPVILGPRGEFSEGALALKPTKKKSFLNLAKFIGLYNNVIWHASSTYEATDIRRAMGNNVSIRLAIDIAKSENGTPTSNRPAGQPFRVVFISRISPKKNLLGALQVLSATRSQISFDVYGPIEDHSYWDDCLQLTDKLPPNVKFHYAGPLAPIEVSKKIAQYDLFLFPTLGENFGHVIAEALFAGLPVLISDATPWRNLSEKGIGWDFPLEQTNMFVECIEACCHKSPEDYSAWRLKIRDWAAENIGNEEAIEENRQLFNDFNN